jgi:hypothetical protein
MKTIYGDATVVRVWLGEEGNRSKEAMWALEQIARERTLGSLIETKVIKNQDLENVTALLQRPWWSRVWVLQEVVLAQKVTIHCGGATLGDESFESLVKDPKYITEFNDVVLDNVVFSVCDEFLWTLSDALHRIRHSRGQKQSPSKDISLMFTMTLGLGVSSYCSDPRDSIYGFLGLADSSITSEIQPDYTISASRVFQNTAVKLTLSLRSLLLFGLTKFRADRIIKVPSWVPDWQRIEPRSEDQAVWDSILRRSQCSRLFCADGSRPMVFEVFSNASVRLSGLLVDQVIKKSPSSIYQRTQYRDHKHLGDRLRGWRQLCYSSRRLDRDDANSYFARLVTNDIYGEVAVDGRLRVRRCSSEKIGEYRTLLSDLEETYGRNKRRERWEVLWNSFFEACTGRHLFLTAAGYAGLGPPELQVGDSIYALAGGRKLYVLRPLPGAIRSQTFNLIGDCYVQGFMDGEAVRGREDDFYDAFIE